AFARTVASHELVQAACAVPPTARYARSWERWHLAGSCSVGARADLHIAHRLHISQYVFPPSGGPLCALFSAQHLRKASSSRLRGAADGEAFDEQRRLADAHRHSLALLAAGADAGVELEVVADHPHLRERARSVADQRRAFDRRADLAVLDEVRLGAREH